MTEAHVEAGDATIASTRRTAARASSGEFTSRIGGSATRNSEGAWFYMRGPVTASCGARGILLERSRTSKVQNGSPTSSTAVTPLAR